MSAAEIIELIKKLPPEEKAEVREFIQSEPASDGVRRMDLEKAKATADKIFDRHAELFRRLAQ